MLTDLCRVLSELSFCRFRGLHLITVSLNSAGCTDKTEFDEGQIDKLIPTNLYNYTKYEIFFAAYHDAAVNFEITSAAPAGATSFRGGAGRDLGSGFVAHIDANWCCFWWDYKENEDVHLKVVWLEIFDSDIYERETAKIDERNVKRALPGSQWCEAIVKVNKPYPSNPGAVVFHFLPDGSVEANIAAASTFEGHEPYTAEKLATYSVRSDRPLCRLFIGNPWYSIPRKPYQD